MSLRRQMRWKRSKEEWSPRLGIISRSSTIPVHCSNSHTTNNNNNNIGNNSSNSSSSRLLSLRIRSLLQQWPVAMGFTVSIELEEGGEEEEEEMLPHRWHHTMPGLLLGFTQQLQTQTQTRRQRQRKKWNVKER